MPERCATAVRSRSLTTPRPPAAHDAARSFVPQLRCRHPTPVDPPGAAMLDRDVQAATEPRMLVEQTAHTHRRLRRPVRAERIVQNDGKPALPRRIPLGIAQHELRVAIDTEHERERRPTVPTATRAHSPPPRPFSRCGAERLHTLCSGPPADSPSAWPKSTTGQAESTHPHHPPRTGMQPPRTPHRPRPHPATPRSRRRDWSRYWGCADRSCLDHRELREIATDGGRTTGGTRYAAVQAFSPGSL